MLGCHTLMLGYLPQNDIEADWHCAFFDDALLGFAAFNSQNPTAAAVLLWWFKPGTIGARHILKMRWRVAELIAHRFKDLTGLTPPLTVITGCTVGVMHQSSNPLGQILA